MKTILLTGFEPFLHKTEPTLKIAEALHGKIPGWPQVDLTKAIDLCIQTIVQEGYEN